MIDKNYIESLTQSYIHAYNIAMSEVRNPSFATQIATGVLLVVAMEMRNKQQSEMNPFTMILGAAINAAKNSEESEESEDKK